MELGIRSIFATLCVLHTTYSTLEGLDDLRSTNNMMKPNPTSIIVRTDSILYASVGQEININFEVTNNQYKNIYYQFKGYTDDYLNLVYVTPPSANVQPHAKYLVNVKILPSSSLGEEKRGLLTFKAKWMSLFEEEVTQEVYYYTGIQKSDSSRPTITYTTSGDCIGYLQPKLCHDIIWKSDISIQDVDSGLLIINSEPPGIILKKKFIVGTKDVVSGYYTANCCQTKLDITATDVYGNENTITIDIERTWLTTGEIASISLGAILLVILIIAVIVCIIYCCKKRRQTLSIYPETIRS
ncbi:uncharacterized protein [Halyomorpha halys]|uniref:uncharacterized protein n=1 Tax=Halyomorpha halys TaxID=286706 RepID=UPI0006D4DD5A|nr:uncharacterized protein LOC106678208 [Halyomorpha halys]